jgi:DNA-binding MarR family transcriptional regulator
MIGTGIYSIKDNSNYEKLISLPPSCKFVLYLLKTRGSLTQKDIIKKSLLPKRTVVFSLGKLYKGNFIKKLPSIRDKRLRSYEILI